MPRTPIPDHLIHRPEKVERNAKRFDYLCRLAEEVAFPVVKGALLREFHETTASGAEILTEEAKQALQTLAEDAAIFQHLDEETVLDELQQSLNKALPPPDEEECRRHTSDFAQVLMSAWLETLRSAQGKSEIMELSDCLIPEAPLSRMSWLVHPFTPTKSKLPETIVEGVSSFAPNEDEIVTVLTSLREELFAVPRVVDLPFDLAMVGAPATMAVAAGVGGTRTVEKNTVRVRVMAHSLFISLLKEMERQFMEQQERERQEMELRRQERERWEREILTVSLLDLASGSADPLTGLGMPALGLERAQVVAASLSAPLPPDTYRCFAALQGSRLPPTKIERKVRKAMAMTITS
jgi:hypothetical protein